MYSFEFIKFIFSMFHSVALVTQVSVSHIGNMQELLMTLLVSSFSLFLFNYSLGDYSAALSLTRAVWYKYVMTVRNMKKFMAVHNITAQSEKRIISYMESQWLYDGGLRNKELLRDLPDFLYNEQQIAYYLNLIQSIPLFQNVPLNVQESLASLAQTEFLPPGEIVVYNGVALKNMYIIDQGYCEVLSEFTSRVKWTLKPNDHFCCIATLLQKPYPLDIRTITHVSLVKISRADVLYAFKLHPTLFETFKILMEELQNNIVRTQSIQITN
ncbi:PREDICTED: potassium voltage-gated channel subfamily H member 8-like [Nicrophorus vespilloides]|uniref:Potassium voltage-gated channel subfamily H member 8-like n=1 Tax=Nicrophorus vespilloides TaxID=110193 RepID=A0ABM1MIN2_NICVS|nr:PREDICTED: potassium voltage-gated channel subfamily H member 8-like [Nicrophorus vespilloides]